MQNTVIWISGGILLCIIGVEVYDKRPNAAVREGKRSAISQRIFKVGAELNNPKEHRPEDPAMPTIVGLAGLVTLLPSAFALSQVDAAAPHVWKLMDQFVAIFLAVAWFQFFDAVLDLVLPMREGGMGVMFSVSYCLLIYLSTIGIAWVLRRKGKTFRAFTSCFAHFVSFAAVKAGSDLQYVYFSGSAVHAAFCCALISVGLALLLSFKGYITPRLMRRSADKAAEEWAEVTDDIGWDIAGMTIAFTATQAMHLFLVGVFDMIEEPEHNHSMGDLYCFLFYAVALVPMGGFVLPWLDTEAESTTWFAHNVGHVARNVLSMMTAWAFLLSIKWALLEHGLLWGRRVLFGKLCVALIVSGVALILVAVIVYTIEHGKGRKRGSREKSIDHLVLESLGLICAWSWENCFDGAIVAAADQGLGTRIQVRLIASLVIPAVLFPVYKNFIKPLADQHQASEEPAPSTSTSSKQMASTKKK